MMNWEKLGLLFSLSDRQAWMKSHGSLPVAQRLRGSDLYRVYFAARDEMNRSHVGCLEFDIKSPQKIMSMSKERSKVVQCSWHIIFNNFIKIENQKTSYRFTIQRRNINIIIFSAFKIMT